MALLVPGLSDGATEKHLPASYQAGDQVEIVVGIQTHPITEEHFIDWVILEKMCIRDRADGVPALSFPSRYPPGSSGKRL